MKKIRFQLGLIILAFSCTSCFAQYSNNSINLFNSGIALHRCAKYELAIEKYNQVLKLQPDFKEAKENIFLAYYKLSYNCYLQTNYEQAISYAKKALEYKSKAENATEMIAKCSYELQDWQNAKIYYDKLILLNPKDDSALHSIAQIYLKTNEYEKAVETYKKILLIYPNDKVAMQNIEFASFQLKENHLKTSLDNLNAEQKAPKSLYKLIKPSYGITAQTVEKFKNILDLIWNEPNGRIMLQALMSKRVKINITQGVVSANATENTQQNTLYIYGFIPVATFTTSITTVNVAFNYISNFYNSNLPSYQRVYNLQVFLHEFGHAFMNIKEPNVNNSIEEEIVVSMIGYNIASKIITGEYLTREQTINYSMDCLQSLLADDHRNLPIYSGFTQHIQKYGIFLPYPEEYSDIVKMYKKLLKEKKVLPTPSFFPFTGAHY